MRGEEERKDFFFEKKKQKTFNFLGSVLSNVYRFVGNSEDAKVFCFFFSKKKCLPSLSILPPSQRLSMAVLICTYKRPDALLPCLQGLQNQILPPDDIIIVARPSDEATHAAMADRAPKNLPWRIVPVHEPGLVAARNAGLAAARTDVVCFCDDDTIAGPHWLATIHDHFSRNSNIGGVGGRDRCHNGTDFDDRRRAVVGHLQWWGRAIGNHHLGFGEPRRVDFLKGANMSFRATAIAGHWFDTRLRGKGAQPNDDFSFSLAIARAGWMLVYDPAALVHHYPAADQLRSYVGRLGLADPVSYAEACYNHSLTIWEQMGLLRRAVFIAWAALVGVSNYPGLLQAVRLRLRHDRAAWRKCAINLAALREVCFSGAGKPKFCAAAVLNTPKAG